MFAKDNKGCQINSATLKQEEEKHNSVQKWKGTEMGNLACLVLGLLCRKKGVKGEPCEPEVNDSGAVNWCIDHQLLQEHNMIKKNPTKDSNFMVVLILLISQKKLHTTQHSLLSSLIFNY
jgi:hypothetical protein